MSCNDLSRLGRDAKDTVSIPIGFSNELQLYTGTPGIVDAMFQSLSGFPMSCNLVRDAVHPEEHMFQSLSGFPMSCNTISIGVMMSLAGGFNPYRVFQ